MMHYMKKNTWIQSRINPSIDNKKKEVFLMKNNLTGEYKEAYKKIQKQITQERLHPRAFKDATNNLIQYLEAYQTEEKPLEDEEVIKKVILKDILYRSKRTHILMWIAFPLMCIFILSVPNIIVKNETIITLGDIVLAFYICFALIEGVPDKFVLLFILSAIPVAFAGVMLENYLKIDFNQINQYAFIIVCLLISLIGYYFINKEYKDWKKS